MSTPATTTTAIVGAAFVPNKRPAPSSVGGKGKGGYKKIKNEAGEERDWIPSTPNDVVIQLNKLMEPAFLASLEFETVQDPTSTVRYITVPAADGTRTKGVNIVYVGQKLWKAVQYRQPSGTIKNYTWNSNPAITNEQYQFLWKERVVPATDTTPAVPTTGKCGPFIDHLVKQFINRPAEIFGPNHEYTSKIAQLRAEDEAALKKLASTKPRMLKSCETDEERQALTKEYEEDELKYNTHRSSYMYIFDLIRIQVSGPKPKDNGDGEWAATWSQKIKRNAENTSDLYPIVSIYDTTTGAEDAMTVPIYFCDQPPTKKQLENPKTGPGKLEDWKKMHDAVVAKYPNPLECDSIVRPFSKCTIFTTWLGINLSPGFIDVNTRVTQVWVMEAAATYNSRRIGELPTPMIGAALGLVAETIGEAAPEDEVEDNVQ